MTPGSLHKIRLLSPHTTRAKAVPAAAAAANPAAAEKPNYYYNRGTTTTRSNNAAFGTTSNTTGGSRLVTPEAVANAVYIAPCPNCLKGTCKIRKHHVIRNGKRLLTLPDQNLSSGMSSYTNSPVKMPANKNAVATPSIAGGSGVNLQTATASSSPISATPYNADDEHSDLELEDHEDMEGVSGGNLPYINLSRINPPPTATPSSAKHSEGRRRSRPKHSPHSGGAKAKSRLPPEGVEPTRG